MFQKIVLSLMVFMIFYCVYRFVLFRNGFVEQFFSLPRRVDAADTIFFVVAGFILMIVIVV